MYNVYEKSGRPLTDDQSLPTAILCQPSMKLAVQESDSEQKWVNFMLFFEKCPVLSHMYVQARYIIQQVTHNLENLSEELQVQASISYCMATVYNRKWRLLSQQHHRPHYVKVYRVKQYSATVVPINKSPSVQRPHPLWKTFSTFSSRLDETKALPYLSSQRPPLYHSIGFVSH